MDIEVKIRRLLNEDRLKALASITIDGMIAIHDIKVIEGPTRMFVAMPIRRECNGTLRDVVHPISSEARTLMENAILTEYHKCLAAQPQLVPKADAIYEMKAITVYQPWASLLASGMKQYETRSWKTDYRGPIAIHAGKKAFLSSNVSFLVLEEFNRRFPQGMDMLPLGCIVATAELVACHKVDKAFLQTLTETERLLGDYMLGRYAWEFSDMMAIDPIPTKGFMKLWNWTDQSAV